MAAEIAAEALEIEKLGIEEEILKKAEDEIKLLKSEPPADLPDLEDVSCEPGEIEYDYVKKDLEPGNDTLDLITSNEKVLTKLDDTNPEDIVLSPVLSPAPDAGRKRNHFKTSLRPEFSKVQGQNERSDMSKVDGQKTEWSKDPS